MKNSETIVDDNGIEVLVGYDYDKTDSYYEEKDNPNTYVPSYVHTKLTSVEIVISGKGVDILPQLNDKQKQFIISKLNYE